MADAYDAMTSKRSYRDPIPQDKVREEIVKGIDTQFDPVYAKLMLHLIDLDLEYEMKEREEVKELAGKNEMTCTNYRSSVSEGIILFFFFFFFIFGFSDSSSSDSSTILFFLLGLLTLIGSGSCWGW